MNKIKKIHKKNIKQPTNNQKQTKKKKQKKTKKTTKETPTQKKVSKKDLKQHLKTFSYVAIKKYIESCNYKRKLVIKSSYKIKNTKIQPIVKFFNGFEKQKKVKQ